MRLHRPRPLAEVVAPGRRPSVTVVIPCYRYGHFLPGAVASAFDQQGLDVDVLIVDDASPDDSAAVARRLAEADERVDVLVHEHNAGHIATYNDGLAKARGDYVVLLSADDLLATDALTRAVALMEAHPGVGLVYGHPQAFGDTPTVAPGRERSWSVYPGRQWLGLAARRGRCFLFSPEAVMRREALAQTDLYEPRLPHSADFDMWLRTALRWDVGRVNGPVQAHYRVHDANMHLTTYAGWLTDLRERRTTFQIMVEERAAGLPEEQRAIARGAGADARRALAREAVRRALAARRDGRHDEVTGLLDFAVETDPGVVRRPEWRLVHRWRGSTGLHRRAWQFAGHVHLHLRWRRTRRWGT